MAVTDSTRLGSETLERDRLLRSNLNRARPCHKSQPGSRASLVRTRLRLAHLSGRSATSCCQSFGNSCASKGAPFAPIRLEKRQEYPTAGVSSSRLPSPELRPGDEPVGSQYSGSTSSQDSANLRVHESSLLSQRAGASKIGLCLAAGRDLANARSRLASGPISTLI